MNPFVNRIHNQNWILPVSAMCMVLGFMVSLAWVTKENRQSRSAYLRGDNAPRVFEAAGGFEALEQATSEVKKLQEEKTKLENAMAQKGDDSKVLNDSLQEMKVFAGLTEVEGPGIVLTIRDSQKAEPAGIPDGPQVGEAIVHDKDVLQTVNELFASGSEAVSVNNLRVSSTSSFRCVGTTILVNDHKIASPVVIRAIGDPEALFGAMNMPGGVLAEIRAFDPGMVQIEKVTKMRIPAYVGTTGRKFAKPPAEKEKEGGKK